jgi:hypothetical protein
MVGFPVGLPTCAAAPRTLKLAIPNPKANFLRIVLFTIHLLDARGKQVPGNEGQMTDNYSAREKL